jgi:hypothetical protein
MSDINPRALVKIGAAAVELKLATVDSKGVPCWWCSCGDLVALDDDNWAQFEKCVNCSAGDRPPGERSCQNGSCTKVFVVPERSSKFFCSRECQLDQYNWERSAAFRDMKK